MATQRNKEDFLFIGPDESLAFYIKEYKCFPDIVHEDLITCEDLRKRWIGGGMEAVLQKLAGGELPFMLCKKRTPAADEYGREVYRSHVAPRLKPRERIVDFLVFPVAAVQLVEDADDSLLSALKGTSARDGGPFPDAERRIVRLEARLADARAVIARLERELAQARAEAPAKTRVAAPAETAAEAKTATAAEAKVDAPPAPREVVTVDAPRWEASCTAACRALVEIVEKGETGITRAALSERMKTWAAGKLPTTKAEDCAWSALPGTYKAGPGRPKK